MEGAGGVDVLDFLLVRQKQKQQAMSTAIIATPPIDPPMMKPTGAPEGDSSVLVKGDEVEGDGV